jgi:hypothetical protein
MSGAEVGPLTHIGFADENRPCRPQFLRHPGISPGIGTQESQRAGSCVHAVRRVNVVLQENGNAVQGAARPPVLALTIQLFRYLLRVRIDFDHRSDSWAALINGFHSFKILLDESKRGDIPRRHIGLQAGDRRSLQMGMGCLN